MTSVAERKRNKKAVTTARAAEAIIAKRAEAAGVLVGAAPRKLAPKKPYVRRETGLALLRRGNRIDTEQQAWGERYHRTFALLELAACSPIASNLNALDAPGGGKGGALPAAARYGTEREILAAKAEIHEVRMEIRLPYLVGALDVICGKQWTPSMVSPLQREQDEIVTSLRIALDMLGGIYKRLDISH